MRATRDDEMRLAVIREARGNLGVAARRLGLHRTTLLEWVETRRRRGVAIDVQTRGSSDTERRIRALREARGNVCLAARLLGLNETTYWRWERRARACGLLADLPDDRACRICHARGVAGTVHNAPCGLVCGDRFGHRGTGHCPRCGSVGGP